LGYDSGGPGTVSTDTDSPASLPLRALAPAKINLGLFVGPLREDGRHELATVMQSISLADELTLRVAPDPAPPTDRVVCPGVPGPPAENLAATALAAFRAATGWDCPPLELTILKRVPVAGGMGGGSGDAAAALRLAARASGRNERKLLEELARALGADVPAQVRPGRWLAGGAGALLQALPEPWGAIGAPIQPTPPPTAIAAPGRAEVGQGAEEAGRRAEVGRGASLGVLVLPLARALSTAQVYAQADRMGLARGGAELEDRHSALAQALAGGAPLPPAELLHNDLQDAARALCPEIDSALSQTREAGADVALLSGSGPTVLGLFAGLDGIRRAREAARALGGRTPSPIAAEPVAAGFAQAVDLAVGNN
jgi:4-diphosphocytidyl-2-C-methyl-D-erythritol kinase